MIGFRDLRSNHDFTVLWVGSTVSELGTRVSAFAFPLLAYALTRSALTASLAEALFLGGMALALLPGGVLTDRVDRGRLMRLASASGVLLYGSIVVAGLLGQLSIAHLLVVAVLAGCGGGLAAPAESSAIRTVVPGDELPTALSQVQARQHVASLVGGPLGGALYGLVRWLPFLADAVSYLVAWVMLGRLRADLSPAPRAGARGGATQDIADGLRFSWGQPFFRVILFWGPAANLVINALFFAATLRLIQAGFAPWSIGLVETSAGVCGVLGALVAPRIIARFRTGRLTAMVAWSFVPLLVPLVLWNQPVVVAAALSVGVFLNPSGNAGIGSYRMAMTPPELMGRVQSTGQFVSWSTMPLAPVLGGGLLAALGGPSAMAALAVLCAGVAAIPTLSRSVRSVPRPCDWRVDGRVDGRVDWADAGGGQRAGARPAAGPAAEGAADPSIRPAGAAAGHA